MFSFLHCSGVIYTCLFFFFELHESSYSFPTDVKLDIRQLIDPLEQYDSLDDNDDNNKKIVIKSVFNVPVRYSSETSSVHVFSKCPSGTQRANGEPHGDCIAM